MCYTTNMNTSQEVPDIFSTYKRDGGTQEENQNIPYNSKTEVPSTPKNTLEICVDGFVRIIRIGAWLLALFSTLFVVTLATNTFDKAVEILKAPLKITFASTDEEKIIPKKDEWISPVSKKNNLASDALNTPTKTATETPEMIAKKRAAMIEARKAARLQQEKLNDIENQIR